MSHFQYRLVKSELLTCTKLDEKLVENRVFIEGSPHCLCLDFLPANVIHQKYVVLIVFKYNHHRTNMEHLLTKLKQIPGLLTIFCQEYLDK